MKTSYAMAPLSNESITKFCDNCPFKQTKFFSLHFVSLALGTHVYYSCELRNKSVILMLKDKKNELEKATSLRFPLTTQSFLKHDKYKHKCVQNGKMCTCYT